MSESFDKLKGTLRKLPTLGAKAAERISLSMLLENRALATELISVINEALDNLGECPDCGALANKGETCNICSDETRLKTSICVVESVMDLMNIEKSGAWRGRYFVLGGKLSPMKRVRAENLRMDKLKALIDDGEVSELILALSNDIEGEATCHYIQECIVADADVSLTRIGFGLPSGSTLIFADSSTIKSAFNSRKDY